MNSSPSFLTKNLKEYFKNDRAFFLKAVSKNGIALKSAAIELRSDKEIVLTAVEHGYSLQNAPVALQADKEVVFACKFYGAGSYREWAAKGSRMLGILAVIAERFGRIHRSNLLGMGALPDLLDGVKLGALGLTGEAEISLSDLNGLDKPRSGLV